MILLVEDNADDELLILHTLQQHAVDHNVQIARDGQQALQYLLGEEGSSQAEQSLPELVLMDIKMPKMSGLEVLRRLRSEQRTRCVPVVLLSSSDETRDIQEAYRLGANSFLRKHTDFQRFTSIVAKAAEYWAQTNLPPE